MNSSPAGLPISSVNFSVRVNVTCSVSVIVSISVNNVVSDSVRVFGTSVSVDVNGNNNSVVLGF